MRSLFYEQLRLSDPKASLLTACVTAGRHAGEKALLEEIDGGIAVRYCEGSFLKEFACSGQVRLQTGLTAYAGETVFVERLPGKRRLVVCGAGHVSMPVIRIADMLDFDITVIEDRIAFAEKAVLSGAGHMLCDTFENALDKVEGDEDTAFVVVTRAHQHDVECLRRILKKRYAYVGMMGSRHRSGLIREQLTAEGFSREQLETVHMPIGLKIHSETPEEIAVSILGEIIMVMNSERKGSGYPQEMLEEILRITEEQADGKKTENAVLSVIIQKNGEAPRKPGTKMLVKEDGSIVGTIGGGLAEAKIIEAGLKLLNETGKERELLTVRMHKQEPEDEAGMYCGGEIGVYLEKL